MSEALLHQDGNDTADYTPVAAATGGQVVCLPDGRAAVIPTDVAAGSLGSASAEGIYIVTKAASLVWVDGCEIWWDHSANAAVLAPSGDKDFYLGVAVGDVAAATVTGKVNLNVKATYLVDLAVHAAKTAIVKTVVGSTTVEVPHVERHGGSNVLILGTTAEAQKVDLLSTRGFSVDSNWIVEGIVNIITNGDASAVDFNIGVASGTHASDADTIAESVFLHVDGASLNIMAESDDGTTEVTTVDTTVDAVLGTPFSFVIDGRDPAGVLLYIDGVAVLTGSTFVLTDATGPLYLLAHLEKSSDDSPGTFSIDQLRVRIANE